jgi:hypothetical protein
MSLINEVVLTALILTSVELHEPGEGGGEYTRGQAELIADACGLPMDIAHDVLMPLLYAQPRQSPDRITEAVVKAASEYKA